MLLPSMKSARVPVLVAVSVLSGCVTDCERWENRLETRNSCNAQGLNCRLETTSVPYCAQRRASAGAGGGSSAQAAYKASPEEVAYNRQVETDRATLTAAGVGLPDLTAFRRDLFALSRAPDLKYQDVNVEMRSAETMRYIGGDSVFAAAKKLARGGEYSSRYAQYLADSPRHGLTAWVIRAHNGESARSLFDTARAEGPGLGAVVPPPANARDVAGIWATDHRNATRATYLRKVVIVRGPYVVIVVDNRDPPPGVTSFSRLRPKEPIAVEPLVRLVAQNLPEH